jgi:hypothetical protein
MTKRNGRTRKGLFIPHEVESTTAKSIERTLAILRFFIRRKDVDTIALCMVALRILAGEWPRVTANDTGAQLAIDAALVKSRQYYASCGDPISTLRDIEAKVGRVVEVQTKIGYDDGTGTLQAKEFLLDVAHAMAKQGMTEAQDVLDEYDQED